MAPCAPTMMPASINERVPHRMRRNVGVTGYRLERCQGAACSAFAEIAAPSTVSFNDTGVVAATSYSYRVRAVDAAGNLGGYSNVASASTSGTEPSSNIAFVQGNYATPQSPTSTVSVRYAAAQNSGDLNVVIVGWSDSRAVVTSVTDTFGNAYAVAAPPTVLPGAVSQVVYYARNIVAAPANTNAVTVQFSEAAIYPDVRILSCSGLDRSICGAVASAGLKSTIGTGAGIDPEEIVHSRYIVLWGTNTIVTNLHSWPLVREAQQRGIALWMDRPPGEIPVRGSEEALSDVLQNLIVNAIEATPPRGSVRVTLARDASRAQISVSDEGPGIPADVQAKIFQPFFTTKPQGTGLGLSITRQIIEEHGGELSWANRPGGGTTFTIRLPVKRAARV